MHCWLNANATGAHDAVCTGHIGAHKDPEYEQVEDLIKQTKLPYKRTNK